MEDYDLYICNKCGEIEPVARLGHDEEFNPACADCGSADISEVEYAQVKIILRENLTGAAK